MAVQEETLEKPAIDGRNLRSRRTQAAIARAYLELTDLGELRPSAGKIAERAGALYDKFVAFIQDLDEVGARLQQLDKAYAGARNKLCEGRGNIISRVENLKLLGARASKSLPVDLLEQAAGVMVLDEAAPAD